MLILVLGNTQTGKTFFIKNRLNKITTEIPTVYTRIDDIAEITQKRADGVVVIEALGPVDVPLELRKSAEWVVFTSICAFERFFCDSKINAPLMMPGEIIRAVTIMHGPRARAIFDRANARLTSYLDK